MLEMVRRVQCLYLISTCVCSVAGGIERGDKDQLLPEMAKAIRQESVSTKSEHYRRRMQHGTHTHTGYPQGGKGLEE